MLEEARAAGARIARERGDDVLGRLFGGLRRSRRPSVGSRAQSALDARRGWFGQLVIDLRSDTQTKPSPGMREAMANAEVGDEQRREDPTVLALEERAARFLGQAEAVYLPTATMANQIALAILGERGTELIVEETAHIMVAELGGAAMHSGLQTRGLPGLPRPPLARAGARDGDRVSDGFHIPRASIVALENTHNSAGGTVWPRRRAARSRRDRARARASRAPRRRATCERVGGARRAGVGARGVRSTRSRSVSRRVSAVRSAL